MTAKKKPFDYINQIQNKTTKIPYNKKDISGWQLSFFLSHWSAYIDIVQKMNRIQMYIPDKQVYNYYFDRIPKGYFKSQWVKKKKNKEQEKQIEEICLKHNVSKDEAFLIQIYKERLNK